MTAAALAFEAGLRSARDGAEDVTLITPQGDIRCRLHPAASGNAGVLSVFGAGGGLGGPAGGVYERLARTLQVEGISWLQLDYRRPAAMQMCLEDVLTGAAFLESLGLERVALIGHSFGGAIVINAGVLAPAVIGVAALSSQSYGVEGVARLSPRPVLFIHGEDDEVLPPSCSVSLFQEAKEPKRLILYPGCLHGLDQCREELDRDLTSWLLGLFRLG